jgi:hypothetical protein
MKRALSIYKLQGDQKLKNFDFGFQGESFFLTFFSIEGLELDIRRRIH